MSGRYAMSTSCLSCIENTLGIPLPPARLRSNIVATRPIRHFLRLWIAAMT
jgi:hypothetical protein